VLLKVLKCVDILHQLSVDRLIGLIAAEILGRCDDLYVHHTVQAVQLEENVLTAQCTVKCAVMFKQVMNVKLEFSIT
jgi:hypothetical protein